MRNNRGRTVVEYMFIISLIAALIVVSLRLFGGYIDDITTRTTCQLMGGIFVEGETVGKGICE